MFEMENKLLPFTWIIIIQLLNSVQIGLQSSFHSVFSHGLKISQPSKLLVIHIIIILQKKGWCDTILHSYIQISIYCLNKKLSTMSLLFRQKTKRQWIKILFLPPIFKYKISPEFSSWNRFMAVPPFQFSR